ncbi:MAG TPA: penicillin-binding protein 2 [Gaiellaceae bacterium]|nr:penicillin-binding protein 2 [Gaiellaceae bacterium]
MSSTGQPLPSFLPPDPKVEEPYLLTPRMAMRVAILGGIALIVFGVLFLRLWSLQILSPDKYRTAALDNQLRRDLIEAPRGTIVDRHGRVLVNNIASTAVVLWPASLPRASGRDTEVRELGKILDIPFPRLRERIRAHRDDPLTPVTLKVAVTPEVIAYLDEHQEEFPGVDLKQTYLRSYPAEELFAQSLGYVGEISSEQLKHMRDDGYRAGDRIGQSGVEAAFDGVLRGKDGIAELRVDSLGRPKSELTLTEAPKPGRSVRLTIDIALQRAAERALEHGIALAHEDGEWAANGGSIVALDPNTGELLAMASNPTFRPSVFTGRFGEKALKPLLDAETARRENYPALNRATAAIYPPGSTFKPVTALAALQEHLVDQYTLLPCTGSYEVPGVTGAGQTFRNWDPNVDRPMAMSEAIAASCDTYFYRLGTMFYDLPPERGHPLQAWASRFGIGASTGVDIGPEERGILPTPEWREATYTNAIDRLWKPGDSIQLTIGQKDVAVTPLQMARFFALVANGGKLVTPYLVSAVERTGGENAAPVIEKSLQPPPPIDSGVSPTAIDVIQSALYDATHAAYGTAGSVFGNFPIPVAGKTGTAEKIVQLPGYSTGLLLDQSWFCAYAPADSPTITACAVIENGGHGGTAAAPAILRLFEHYFRTKAPPIGEINSD